MFDNKCYNEKTSWQQSSRKINLNKQDGTVLTLRLKALSSSAMNVGLSFHVSSSEGAASVPKISLLLEMLT